MDNVLHIRKATVNDIHVIRYLAHNTWPEAYGKLLSPDQLAYMLDMMYSESALEKQMNTGHQFYLAVLNDTPLGFASVSQENPAACKLNKLYVLPSSQGTGTGRALLNQAIDYTRSKECTGLLLQVKKDNPAKSFYEKHGFTIQKEIVLDIGNGYVMDDYIMQLAI